MKMFKNTQIKKLIEKLNGKEESVDVDERITYETYKP